MSYNVGTGRETTLAELVSIIGAVTGRVPSTSVDLDKTEDTYQHIADISRLRVLGYRPSVPLESGVRSLVEALGPRPVLPTLPTVFTAEAPGPDVAMLTGRRSA
jgi:UDP-glucose 4-epimerase